MTFQAWNEEYLKTMYAIGRSNRIVQPMIDATVFHRLGMEPGDAARWMLGIGPPAWLQAVYERVAEYRRATGDWPATQGEGTRDL
jgi:hypothetical protein